MSIREGNDRLSRIFCGVLLFTFVPCRLRDYGFTFSFYLLFVETCRTCPAMFAGASLYVSLLTFHFFRLSRSFFAGSHVFLNPKSNLVIHFQLFVPHISTHALRYSVTSSLRYLGTLALSYLKTIHTYKCFKFI